MLNFYMRWNRIFFLLSAIPLLIGAQAIDSLKGPSFTSPSRVQEMPAEWVKEPIRHAPEVGRVDLAVTLDQHLYPLFKEHIEKFAAQKGLKVSVSEGTCGITAGKLARKSVDMGGFCCPPGEIDRLPGLRFHTVGVMPVAVIVHPDNPMEDIKLEDARKLFGGKIYLWSELKDGRGRPGPNLKVRPIGRLHCKLRPGHWRLLLDNEDLFSPNLTEVGTIPDMISLVAKTPGAVGYEVPLMVERYAGKGRVKTLKLNGLLPAATSLAGGGYPVYRTLNLATWEGKGLENENARALVDYILKEAERLEGKYGLVSASGLRKAGWKFKGDELVGEP